MLPDVRQVITLAGAIIRYEYDAAGRPEGDTPGFTIEFTYDSQGRLQSKQFADGTQSNAMD